MKFQLLSISGGKLSKRLDELFFNNDINLKKNFLDKSIKNTKITSFLIATYSPTLRNDNLINYQLEIDYYKKIIKNLTKEEHLIFISSQTLELTDNTNYSRAKFKVEEILKRSRKNFTIVRPGMIFDSDINKFTLKSMQNASESIFTFYRDVPKITVCSIWDIYRTILIITSNLDLFRSKTINLGIKKYSFLDLQNIAKKKFRIPIIPFALLVIFSIFSVRLRAYVNGQALQSSPPLALKGSYD